MSEYTPEQLELSTTARSEWDNYKEIKDVHSDYEVQKGITRMGSAKCVYLEEGMKSVFNLTGVKGNCLIVPLYNIEGKFMAMQALLPAKIERSDGATNKLFPAGGAMMHSYYSRHKIEPNGEVYLCEGYATAASVRDAKNDWNIIVCLCCANIPKVAADLRGKYPYLKINYLSDNDLFTKDNPGLSAVKEAVKITGTKYGGKIYTPAFYPPKDKSTTDFNDMVREHGIDELKARLNDKDAVPQPMPIKLCGIHEFVSMPIPQSEWLIDGMVAKQFISLFVGVSGVGKSVIIRQMALCAARSIPFLDRATKPSKILWVAMEEPQAYVQKNLMALGTTPMDNDYFKILWPWELENYITDAHKRGITFTRIQALAEIAKMYRVDITVIDTMINFTPTEKTSEYGVASKIMYDYRMFVRETNSALALLHHMNKGSKDDTRTATARSMGSEAFIAGSDVRIGLEMDKDDVRWIWVKGRTEKPMPKTRLHWDSATWWGTKGEVFEEEKRIEKEKNKEDIIKSTLISLGAMMDHKGVTSAAIGHKSGINRQDLKDSLEAMVTGRCEWLGWKPNPDRKNSTIFWVKSYSDSILLQN